MARCISPLALVALIAIAGATIAAWTGNVPTHPSRVSPSQTKPRPPQRAAATPVDPVVNAARRYALAARNWTAATYRGSWNRQIELAGGPYRRALVAARPGRPERAALHMDRARSSAKVLRIDSQPRMSSHVARVVVTLTETTSARGQTIQGVTLNEARLQRRNGRWLVVGWTVIPGGG